MMMINRGSTAYTGLSNTMASPTMESHTMAEEAIFPISALLGIVSTIHRPAKPPAISTRPPTNAAARPTCNARPESPVCQYTGPMIRYSQPDSWEAPIPKGWEVTLCRFSLWARHRAS